MVTAEVPRVGFGKNKYHFKMADKQRAQVCRHNKDKSYRSRLTHARIRALPFDLERKPLLGDASFFFFTPLPCPCQDILPEHANRTRQQEGCSGFTHRVRLASLGGRKKKEEKKKWRHMNRSTFNHRHLSTSARRLPVQACGVFFLFCMHGRRSRRS